MLMGGYLSFPQIQETNAGIVSVNRLRPHPSTFFSIHYLSVILLLDFIQSEILTVSLNKQQINT